MPTPRANLATSTVNGKVYAIGGSQGLLRRALSTVEAYDTGLLPQSVRYQAEKIIADMGCTKS